MTIDYLGLLMTVYVSTDDNRLLRLTENNTFSDSMTKYNSDSLMTRLLRLTENNILLRPTNDNSDSMTSLLTYER